MKKTVMLIGLLLVTNFSKATETDTLQYKDYVLSVTETCIENDEETFRDLIGINKAIKSFEMVGFTDHGLYRIMVKDSTYVQNEFITSFRKLSAELRQKLANENGFDLDKSFSYNIIQIDNIEGINMVEIRVSLNLPNQVLRFDIVLGNYNKDTFIFIPMNGYILPN